MFGVSETNNSVSNVAKDSVRQSAMEAMTSQRLSRLRRVRDVHFRQSKELHTKKMSNEGVSEDDMFVDNPMRK